MPDFYDALRALDDAQVVHCVHKRGTEVHLLQGSDDLDVLVARGSLHAADRALLAAGFRRLHAPGHGAHRFYLATDDSGRWRKIDLVTRVSGSAGQHAASLLARRRRVGGVWVPACADDSTGPSQRSEDPDRDALRRRLRRLLPPSIRRRAGPVLAVLGPDGASELIDAVSAELPIGVTTVRIDRPVATRAGGALASGAPGQLVLTLGAVLALMPKLLRIYLASWQGHVVLCDGHPCGVLASPPAGTARTATQLQSLLVRRVPQPDQVLVLDVSGEAFAERAPQTDAGAVARGRRSCLRTFAPPGVVLDARGSLHTTVEAALAVVWRELWRRQGEPGPDPAPHRRRPAP